jgi:glycosyltransferase involved in cell wall biosynthesis
MHVPNPVDPSILTPHIALNRSSERSGPVQIVAVGRLVRQKRFDLLLEAMDQIRSRAAVRLTIYGEGVERSKLETLRDRLGLGDVVSFAGFERDINKIYLGADAFVLSSDFEGFGNVIVEALAFGLPVVSTDSPYGPRDILDGGKYGVLVPCGSSSALAGGILRVLPGGEDRDELCRVANGRAQEYSAPLVALRLREALLQVPLARR